MGRDVLEDLLDLGEGARALAPEQVGDVETHEGEVARGDLLGQGLEEVD